MYYGFVQEGDKYAVLMDEEDLVRLVVLLGNQQTAGSSQPVLRRAWPDLNCHLGTLGVAARARYRMVGDARGWKLEER